MQRLYRKRIVLGVGGGIAAYKSAELVRRLLDHGAEVRVVMTRGGSEFITPLTMQALSGHPVHLDLSDTPFIDSAGIRVLVRSMWDLRDRGSALSLVAASPMAENILRITGILDVLKDPSP